MSRKRKIWIGIGVQTSAYTLELLPDVRNSPVAFALDILAAGL